VCYRLFTHVTFWGVLFPLSLLNILIRRSPVFEKKKVSSFLCRVGPADTLKLNIIY